MKIINTVYGDATGGRWQAMLNVYDTLTLYGHNVVLLRGEENAHLSSGDRPIHVIANTGFYSILGALKVRKFIEQQQPDVIIAHSGKAVWLFKNAMLGMAKKIPIIAVNHSHNVKRTLRADAFMNISPYVQELIEKRQSESERKHKPQRVIFNLTRLPTVPAEPQLLRTPVTIAMLTRMVPNKGVHVVIDALAILKQKGIAFNAVLAGEGEQLETYKQQAKDLGLLDCVSFPGWVNGEAKDKLMQHVDIIALPSLVEIQPLGILDTFAWGKTLITSEDIGICQSAKHNINAWCSKTGDAQSLADGLIYLIDNPQQALRLAQQGKKEAVEKYCFEQTAKQHNDFVQYVFDYYQQNPL